MTKKKTLKLTEGKVLTHEEETNLPIHMRKDQKHQQNNLYASREKLFPRILQEAEILSLYYRQYKQCEAQNKIKIYRDQTSSKSITYAHIPNTSLFLVTAICSDSKCEDGVLSLDNFSEFLNFYASALYSYSRD